MSKDMDEERLKEYLEGEKLNLTEAKHVQPFGIKFEVELYTLEQFKNKIRLFKPRKVFLTTKRAVFIKEGVSYTYVFE